MCSSRTHAVKSPDAQARCLDIAQLVCGLSSLRARPRRPWGHELLRALAAESARNAQHFEARDIQVRARTRARVYVRVCARR